MRQWPGGRPAVPKSFPRSRPARIFNTRGIPFVVNQSHAGNRADALNQVPGRIPRYLGLMALLHRRHRDTQPPTPTPFSTPTPTATRRATATPTLPQQPAQCGCRAHTHHGCEHTHYHSNNGGQTVATGITNTRKRGSFIECERRPWHSLSVAAVGSVAKVSLTTMSGLTAFAAPTNNAFGGAHALLCRSRHLSCPWFHCLARPMRMRLRIGTSNRTKP